MALVICASGCGAVLARRSPVLGIAILLGAGAVASGRLLGRRARPPHSRLGRSVAWASLLSWVVPPVGLLTSTYALSLRRRDGDRLRALTVVGVLGLLLSTGNGGIGLIPALQPPPPIDPGVAAAPPVTTAPGTTTTGQPPTSAPPVPTTRAAPRASPGAEPATPRHAAVAATGVAPLKQAWSQVSPAGSSAAPPTGVATVLGRSDVLPGDFGALALDPTLGRVFVSSPSAGAVSVLDLDARLVGTLESIPGAGALWVDGNRLYVAAATAGRIAVFDTATLDPVATLADGLLVNPTSLVKAGGRLWTTTGRCRSDEVRIVSIDPASGAVVVHPAVDLMSYCISLTASPAAPDVLLAFEDGRSAAVIHRLDVSGPAPVASISRSVGGLENLRQLAVLPGGSGFVAAAGAPHDIRQFRLSDLDVDGTCYITGAYPNAVAATAGSGGLLAAGRTGLEPTVDVFRIGDPSARVVAYRPPAPGHVMDRGLAWSPDGGRLLVMTGRIHPVRDVRLDVLGVPA